MSLRIDGPIRVLNLPELGRILRENSQESVCLTLLVQLRSTIERSSEVYGLRNPKYAEIKCDVYEGPPEPRACRSLHGACSYEQGTLDVTM